MKAPRKTRTLSKRRRKKDEFPQLPAPPRNAAYVGGPYELVGRGCYRRIPLNDE